MADAAVAPVPDHRCMTDAATTIQEIYAAFGRGDLAAILERVAEPTDWCCEIDAPGGHAVPMMRNVTTRADVAETYFGNVVATMEMHHFLPKQLLVDGNDVVVLLELEYTVRSTGRRIKVDEVHHFTVVDGQVVRYRPYVDTAAMVDAFGG
jgi:ketosteroid isomerase-like protein